jgi:predicted amidophosphoribosyltransferase
VSDPLLSHCPVCKARFRGTRHCSRCGADLQPLMLLTVQAFQLRRAAREALYSGDYPSAHRLASQAQTVRSTAVGRHLLALSLWLASGGSSPVPPSSKKS